MPVEETPSDRARDDAGRHETEAERIDRNLTELLQELRIAGIGVQVLFGFLLSLPFTGRFDDLDATQRNVYLVDVLLSALAISLLSAPVAFHRLVFRRHAKARTLRFANVMAIAGLGAVGLAVSFAVVLVVSFVEEGAVVPVVTAITFAAFAGLWFVLPLVWRGHDDY